MKMVGAVVVICLALFSQAWAQGRKPGSLADLAVYSGADRDQILIAGAKAEGRAVWYTSLAGSSYKEITKAFEAKYPGIRIEVYRGTSKDLTAKIVAESQAGRFLMDAVETTLPLLKLMRESKLIALFDSPALAKYPELAKQKGDKGRVLWAVDRESYVGFAYNKNSIPGPVVPKSYGDLLNPALKGKMGFATSDTGPRTVAGIIAAKGEEFLKKLKAQEISLHTISGRAMVDLVASGEVGASPTIFRSHASEVAENGAPVAWVPMEIVPTNAGGVSLSSRAPHPHAAILLVDFLFGAEAQKILEKLQYGNPTQDYGFKRWYPEAGMNTEQYERANDRWEKLLRGLGRKA